MMSSGVLPDIDVCGRKQGVRREINGDHEGVWGRQWKPKNDLHRAVVVGENRRQGVMAQSNESLTRTFPRSQIPL